LFTALMDIEHTHHSLCTRIPFRATHNVHASNLDMLSITPERWTPQIVIAYHKYCPVHSTC